MRPGDGLRLTVRRLGELGQQGVAQALELGLEASDAAGALRRQLGGADAAPAQAELEQRGRADMRSAAAQRVGPIAEGERVLRPRRRGELRDQLLGVDEEVVDDLADEAVLVVELAQPLEQHPVERG